MLVTACRDGDNNLKLIAWSVTRSGDGTRLGDSGEQGEFVSDISLATLSQGSLFSEAGGEDRVGRVATTSVRTEEDTLKVIVWEVSAEGEFTRLGDGNDQGRSATLIKSAASGGRLITSYRTAEGDLMLSSFSVSPDGKAVTPVGDTHYQAGAIGEHALIGRPYGVLSAVQTAKDDNLKLIAWSVTQDGQMRRLGDSTDDQVGSVSLIALEDFGGPHLVTAVATGERDLRIITWSD